VVDAFQAAGGIAELARGRRAPACSRLSTWRRWMRRSRGSSPGALQVSALCWQGDVPADGQLIDTITSERGSKSEQDVRKPHKPLEHPDSWTAVWAYSKKRATRNTQTLTA
jgi:transposase, IS4 family protein